MKYLKKMKKPTKTILNDKYLKEEDELIENIDDFGIKKELNTEIFSSKLNKFKKIILNNKKITNESKQKKKSKITPILEHKTISHLVNSKIPHQLSNAQSNLSIKIKTQKIKSPIKDIILNNSNNVCNKNSFFTSKKSIFSKISENLYNSYRDNLSSSKKLLTIKTEDDNYNILTVDKYISTLADKENNISNTTLLNNYKKVYIKNNKLNKNLTESKTLSENNTEIFLSSSKRGGYRKKVRTPAEFLEDQKRYMEKHKVHIEKITKEQNIKFNKTMKNKPTISNDSRKIANNLKIKIKGDNNIYNKLYNDFSLREKNKEEMIKNSNKNYLTQLGISSNKKLSHQIIKQNSERLYKEYIKKDLYIKENKSKQINQLRIMALTKYMNESSNNILFSKFINKYKKILNSQFNKTIEDNFEIIFQEYLILLIELDAIDKYYKIIFKNEEEKNYFLFMKKNIENQNISSLWKSKDIFKTSYIINNNEKKNHFELKYKNKKEYKLIKDSWKIITKNKEFNMGLIGNSKRVLLFLLSVLGIYDGNLNSNFIRNECAFLFGNEEDQKYFIDKNFSKQIFKYFTIFKKTIFENLIHKKNEFVGGLVKSKATNDVKKIMYKKLNYMKTDKLKNINNKEGIIPKNKKLIYKLKNNSILKTKISNNINNNYYSNTEVNYESKLNMKKFINSKKSESGSFNSIPIRKLKWTFKIKIDNDMKKIVIYEDDDKIKKIEEFCKLYNLDDFEKEQIIKIIAKKFDK